MDMTAAVVPLWAAIVAAGGILSALGAIVVWVFSTFETKVESTEKHESHSKRLDSQGEVLLSVAKDVSYIRGRIEPK